MKNIQLPSSKSISNRVLLLAALSDTPVMLENLLVSDDTKYMQQALEQFGVMFEEVAGGLSVDGKNSRLAKNEQQIVNSELYIGNAGTAARFLSCVSLLLSGGDKFTLTGNEYMEKRPQGDLFESLRSIGVGVECLKEEGCLPVRMLNTKEHTSNTVSISGKVSSQFLSGLLLAASRMKDGLIIEIIDDIPSWPYVEMTIQILKIWGVSIELSDDQKRFVIKPGMKAPKKYIIPSDMSAASYPLAWSVLKKEKICITNFGSKTLQGDEGFLEIIEKVGATVRRQGEKCYIDPPKKLLPIGKFNWEKMPDVSMTGMILAACVGGESQFTGLESLRVKECDRIKAMSQLLKCQRSIIECRFEERLSDEIAFEIEGNEVIITGRNLDELKIKNKELRTENTKNCKLVTVNSFDDHRIAMCFGILRSAFGLGSDYYNKSWFQITDPQCVAKTWPNFWVNLADWEGELRAVSGIVVKKNYRMSNSECRVKATENSQLKTDNAQYLIVKKPRKDNAWQFPQGGVDKGETTLQAAKRELKEECGRGLYVKFKGERPVGEYKYFFPTNFKRHSENIVGAKVQFFEAEYLRGEVMVDGEEIIDYKWVNKAEFGGYFEKNYLEVVRRFL